LVIKLLKPIADGIAKFEFDHSRASDVPEIINSIRSSVYEVLKETKFIETDKQ
jgi:hypothetical protein